jgi:hypothetical protein
MISHFIEKKNRKFSKKDLMENVITGDVKRTQDILREMPYLVKACDKVN